VGFTLPTKHQVNVGPADIVLVKIQCMPSLVRASSAPITLFVTKN